MSGRHFKWCGKSGKGEIVDLGSHGMFDGGEDF